MKLRNAALAVSIFSCAGLVLAAVARKGGIFRAQNSRERPVAGKQEPDGGDLIRHRIAWFHNQRAYPLPRIPAFAREQAWHVFRQMQMRQAQIRAQRLGAAMTSAVADPPAAWTPIGPQPTISYSNQPFVSGRVSAMAVDSEDPTGNTVFLAGAQGGLWVTTNGGALWSPAADQTQLPSLAAGSLALDASVTPPIVYVGTGEENFFFDSYYGAGILKCQSPGSLTAYVCTPDQTLGKFHAPSSANGQSASPLDDTVGGAFVGGLAVDPANSLVILAAVQGFSASLPSGIWCSNNAGVNWTVLSNTAQVVGTGVAFDTDGTAYAALGSLNGNTSNGVYKSNGPMTAASCNVSFQQLTLPVSSSIMGRIALAVGPPASGQTKGELFAAIASAIAPGVPSTPAGAVTLGVSSPLLGVFKSVDGGNTWTQLSGPLVTSSGGFCNDQCFYDLTIAVNPQNPNVVLAGGAAPGAASGATLVESLDGGATWSDVSNNASGKTGIHVALHAIAFKPDGSAVYVGTDGGVWSAANPTSPPFAWNNLNATLALTQFYPGMSLDPSGWQFLSIGGTQDNGSQTYSGTDTWNDTLSCGNGGFTAIDTQTPSTVYVACAYVQGELVNIEKSLFSGGADDTAGATTFFSVVSGIIPTDPGNFIPPLAIDPTNTLNVYFGTNHVWQTQDGATTWRAISPDVTGAVGPGFTGKCGVSIDCVLTSIAVAPTNPGVIITGSSIGHVSISFNGGETWTDVTGTPLPPRSITHVAVDPHNSNVLYATFSGFSCPPNVNCGSAGFNSGDTSGHVFEGALTVKGTPPTPTVTWTDLSSGLACLAPAGNLPNIPVNDLVIDPTVAGMVYAATDVGVLEGDVQPTGTCWQPLGSGLPNIAVLSLELHAASRTLVAGTHGRGAWALPLGGLPAFSLGGLSPASEKAGGSAFTLSMTGTGFTSSSAADWTPASGATIALPQLGSTASCGLPACMSASVPASLIASSGIVHVNVADPGQVNPTNQLTFTLVSQAPTITNISPTTSTAPLTPAGGTATTGLAITGLAITGTNFAANTTVSLAQLNLLPANCASTTFNSSTSLTTLLSPGCFQDGGTFFVIANTPSPGGGSSNQTLSTTDPGSCQGTSNPGCLLAITGPVPGNDAFANATSITATNTANNSYTTTEDTSGATADGPSLMSLSCGHSTSLGSLSPPPANNGDAKSVWFSFEPTVNLTVELDTIGSNYNTILSVWTGSSASALTNVGCNDDIVPGFERVSQITNLSLTASTTYYFMVSAYGIPTNSTTTNPDGGKLVFNLSAQQQTSSQVSFTAAATTASPSSIVSGSTSSFTITFTAQPASPSGPITLDPCTSSPSTTTITCSYSPSSTIPLSSNGTATANVTIQTVARSSAAPRGAPFQSPPLPWVVSWLAAMLALAFVALRRPVARRPAGALALAVLVAGLLLFQGACGGGSSSSTSAGTPAGTYTITIPTAPAAANASITASLTVR